MLSFFSFSMEAQFVNRFKDSSYFKLGVKFDSAITFIKDAGEGKVLTSDSNGYAQWRTPLVYVTEKQLSDSIVSVRMYRNVDTIYKNTSENTLTWNLARGQEAIKNSKVSNYSDLENLMAGRYDEMAEKKKNFNNLTKS